MRGSRNILNAFRLARGRVGKAAIRCTRVWMSEIMLNPYGKFVDLDLMLSRFRFCKSDLPFPVNMRNNF